MADANFNRAREGLRVVEDIARFVVNDRDIARSIKNMRSDIAHIQKKYKGFIFFRNTESDVGTKLNSTIEKNRNSLEDIAEANIKRVQEALRVLEEIFKITDIETSSALKNIRYKSYTIEKGIVEKLEG